MNDTPPTAAAKGPVIFEVHAWACGQCKKVHSDPQEARDCCACSECGTQFPRNGSYNPKCGHCSYGERLRHARSEVRRAKDSHDGAVAHLEKILANKRPEKGSVR